jgi:DNA helicase MCM9
VREHNTTCLWSRKFPPTYATDALGRRARLVQERVGDSQACARRAPAMAPLKSVLQVDVILPSEYMELMADYISKHHTEEIREILLDSSATTAKHHSISINMLDLMWENAALGTLLLHQPTKLQQLFDDAVLEVQDRHLQALQEARDSDAMFMTIKTLCHARMHQLPRCAQLCKPTVSSIRADDINRLISVSGTIIRTGAIKMLQSRREYTCAKCKHRFFCMADVEQRYVMNLPAECPSGGLSAKPCTGTKFDMVEGSQVCRDYQEVRIQEQVHRLTVGSIPRSITLVLQVRVSPATPLHLRCTSAAPPLHLRCRTSWWTPAAGICNHIL